MCVKSKDKLSAQELENVLNYAKTVFSKYFKELIAISCKEAKDETKYEESNFNLLLDFLDNLDEKALKQKFTKRKMLHLCQVLEDENRLFVDIFDKLANQFQIYQEKLNSSFDDFIKEVQILNHQILNKLKSIGERIASEIFNCIKEKEAHFYKEAKGFLKKDLYVKYDYKAPFISSDDAFLAMFYNSDIMNKEFKKSKMKFTNHLKK